MTRRESMANTDINKKCVLNDVMMFKGLTLTPFCSKKWYFNDLPVFNGIWFESCKICKTNDHTCFIALTRFGSKRAGKC